MLLHVTPKRARLLGDRYAAVLADAASARAGIARPEPTGLVVRPRGPLLPRPRRAPRT
jgi:hypothetical protein